MTGQSEDRDRPHRRARAGDPALDAASEGAVLRWLAGEMDAAEARAFEARLAAEPDLARAAEARRRTWRRLEAPASAPGEGVPPGFAGRVMSEVRQRAGSSGRGSLSAAWSRAAGAAALAGGLALGLGLAQMTGPVTGPVTGSAVTVSDVTVSAVDDDPFALSFAYGDLYSGLGAASAQAGATGDEGGENGGTSAGSLAADYAAALSELASGEGT